MKLNELLEKEIKGKVIAFPTDTVYGVGCLIDDEESISKIYELKERDFDKPLAVLVGTLDDAIKLVNGLNEEAVELIKKYWPGALTIICEKGECVPKFLNPKFSTIGIRMPNSEVALEILRKYGPMAVTSVNKSGEIALNDYSDICSLYGDKIDYIVESNEVSSNVSSTVIEVNESGVKVLRQGDIKIKD